MILAGTGHRPDKLGGYEPWNAANWIELAEFILEQWRPERVISGMALGWDTYLATAAVKVGIPFVAAIPFVGQESQWPLASQMRYWELLGQAADIVVVCSGGFSAAKMQERNKWMVDHCDLLLACWDGSPGGTANCVEYAKRRGRAMYNCYADI